MTTSTASALLHEAVRLAPAQYHTVSRLHEVTSSEGGALPWILPYDLEDGSARSIGQVDAVGLQLSGSLPALLFFEIGYGFGVMITLWHRDESIESEASGARIASRTMNAAVALHRQMIRLLEDQSTIDILFQGDLRYSFENAYSAFACQSTYRFGTCKLPEANQPFQGILPGFW